MKISRLRICTIAHFLKLRLSSYLPLGTFTISIAHPILPQKSEEYKYQTTKLYSTFGTFL